FGGGRAPSRDVLGRSHCGAAPHVESAGISGSITSAAGGRGARLVDLCSGGRHGIPAGSEGVHALAVGLARLCVLDEGVERMMVVRHLEASVGASRRSDERCLRAALDARLPARDQWRPEDRALSYARTLAVVVLLEQVEGATVRGD